MLRKMGILAYETGTMLVNKCHVATMGGEMWLEIGLMTIGPFCFLNPHFCLVQIWQFFVGSSG